LQRFIDPSIASIAANNALWAPEELQLLDDSVARHRSTSTSADCEQVQERTEEVTCGDGDEEQVVHEKCRSSQAEGTLRATRP
jgi:hypothetical protein